MKVDALLHKAIDIDQTILLKLEQLEREYSQNLLDEIKDDLMRQVDVIQRARKERRFEPFISV